MVNFSAGTLVPAIRAATVILVGDHDGDVQALFVRRTAGITFGGCWVFPGGRVEPGDGGIGGPERAAAVREVREETGIVVEPDALIPVVRWTPPPIVAKRFDTMFFLAESPSRTVALDDREVDDFVWASPTEMLARHAAGEVDLTPPTWVTLQRLTGSASVAGLISRVRGSGSTETFVTRPAVDCDGHQVLLWHGDASYSSGVVDTAGARHRLTMTTNGWHYERT